MGQPFLLHSLMEFRTLIRGCLEEAGARMIVEVGSESGEHTRDLLQFAIDHDGELWCVEPQPALELERLDSDEARFHLIRGRSPERLGETEAADAYLIDGDHNYWTVSAELAHVDERARQSGRPAIVFLHDVSWPCGRRDAYYAPDALPPGAVHPHSFELGVVPGREEAGRDGFRGVGVFAFALQEGGPRNGVLTAIEDFLADREEHRYVHVPAVMGLGVIFSRSAPYAERLERLLAPLDRNELLASLERNRVELYLRVLELGDHVSDLGLRQSRVLAEYDASLSEAQAEAATLRLEVAKLREQVKQRVDAAV